MASNALPLGDTAKKVLLIDDDYQLKSILETYLRANESLIEMDYASDVYEALAKLNEEQYDLILLDYKMPGVLGSDVIGVIENRADYGEVVMFTNFADDPEVIKNATMRGTRIIPKWKVRPDNIEHVFSNELGAI